MKCKDCGCILETNICSSCHEELYILNFQSEHIEEVSNDFSKKAKIQLEKIKNEKS